MKRTLNQIHSIPSRAQATAYLRSHRRWLMALALLIAITAIGVAWETKRRAEREFDAARATAGDRSMARFEKSIQRAFTGDQVRLIQSSRAVRGIARFDGSIFAATEGGLVEFEEDGKLKRRYTVLDGLPESDLTSIAVFDSRLFLGSRSKGLIVFDRKRFERYRWTDRNAQAVTALVENMGRLLIGTFAGGLLEFDGKGFTEIKVDLDQGRSQGQKRLAGINCLIVAGSRLFVGTFADGLWVSDTGGANAPNMRGWAHFAVADGLPSNRIVGVAPDGDRLFVASDFGVAVAQADQLRNGFDSSQKRFQTVAILPELSSAVKYGEALWVCKDNGEIFRLLFAGGSNGRNGIQASFSPVAWKRPESLSSCQLAAFVKDNQPMGETLWLTSSEGMWRFGWQDEGLSGAPRISRFGAGSDSASEGLTSNVISSLAFDDQGRLWAGSFRNGIDVMAPADGAGVASNAWSGRRITHLESETVHEINALVWDGDSKRMLAATAQGLTRFDPSFGAQRLGAADGALSDSIAHVALIQSDPRSNSKSDFAGLALATSRGLSLSAATRFSEGQFSEAKFLRPQFRGLTTVQGLPGNSVYSVLSHREFIYAGTLGGLAQIAGGRVVRVFKDSNSKLTQNWVTALCETGQRLFVGTYGGGVFELTPAGEFVSFASEIGKQTVNPNAMASDGERLYVGALDGAWVLDLRSQKWSRLNAELPSNVVLSMAFDQERVYFGTTSGIARVDKDYLKRIGE
jgi:ligand-binding sensor domain-containing protein